MHVRKTFCCLCIQIDQQLEELARDCRDNHKWCDDLYHSRGSNRWWKKQLKHMLVCHTVFHQRRGWQEVLTTGAEKLKADFPDESNTIETFKNKQFTQSTLEKFLTAKAYQWLQHLDAHPPKDSAWYPHLAVEVAHKVFRMIGKLATFQKYLSGHPARKRLLESILLSGEGRSSHMRSIRSP